MILEGKVYRYEKRDEDIRIIYVNHKEDEVYYIKLNQKTSLPVQVKISKLNDELKFGVLKEIDDIYYEFIDESKVKAELLNKRDKDYEVVELLWNNRKEEFLRKKGRTKLLSEVGEEFGINLNQVKRILTRYFVRGMTKNSLIPMYHKSGGKGKDKKLSDKKIGKPRDISFNGEEIRGINVNEDIKKIFQLSIDRFYLKKEKPSIKYAYDRMLKEYFSDKLHHDGEILYKVWDENRLPTYTQFYYWFNKKKDFKKNIIAREGEKNFELKHRVLLGNSTIETEGPGSRFQVDATIADLYLVSEFDRTRIIGRPIVYAIIDVYSRLFTGIYVGLEGPSWMGAMMALDNMLADKVQFCREYGIEITEEQWPSKHLPEVIIADRGEFEGYSPEGLINNLGIKIENTSPYRGDLKGIVERNFRTTNERIKHQTPGAILKEFRKRGDRDYRLDATLTLQEFIRIYINIVIHHNNTIINGYPLEKDAVKDNIAPIPSILWNWGIKNKKGRLRSVARDTLRLNMLPKGKATISRAGLKFKGMFYSSKKAIMDQYFINPKKTKVEVVYDPRNMEHIYILESDGVSYEKFNLIEKSRAYRGSYLEEIVFIQELKREMEKAQNHNQKQLDINLQESIEKIVKNAKKERLAEEHRDNDSNAKKIKGIRLNRSIEKEMNRKTEGFSVGEEEKKEDSVVLEIFNRKEDVDASEKTTRYKSIMEKLKKKRDEKIGRS